MRSAPRETASGEGVELEQASLHRSILAEGQRLFQRVRKRTFPQRNPQEESRPGDCTGRRRAIPFFLKSVPNCSFPKLPIRDGKTGMIAPDERVRSLRGSPSLAFDTGRFQAKRFLP